MQNTDKTTLNQSGFDNEKLDLALLVRRLCRIVAKHDANNQTRAQALDYLHRKGLGGSPLKSLTSPSKSTIAKT